jgi:hypothetical protein
MKRGAFRFGGSLQSGEGTRKFSVRNVGEPFEEMLVALPENKTKGRRPNAAVVARCAVRQQRAEQSFGQRTSVCVPQRLARLRRIVVQILPFEGMRNSEHRRPLRRGLHHRLPRLRRGENQDRAQWARLVLPVGAGAPVGSGRVERAQEPEQRQKGEQIVGLEPIEAMLSQGLAHDAGLSASSDAR